MNTELQQLLDALSETAIARNVYEKHDDVRSKYTLESNKVSSEDEFYSIVGDYYNYHYSATITQGGQMREGKATQQATKALERAYRRKGQDSTLAFRNAQQGLDGGLRRVLDAIADEIKAEDEEDYMDEVFAKYVKRHTYEKRVEIIRQFIDHCDALLGEEIERSRPEAYADNYKDLIRSYLHTARGISQKFRSM